MSEEERKTKKELWTELIAARRVVEAARRLKGTYLLRLLHGDKEHQQWLRDESAAVFAPVDDALSAYDAAVKEK